MKRSINAISIFASTLLLPALLLAQSTETLTFAYTQNGAQIITERVTKTANAWDGDIRVGNGQRIAYAAKLADGIVTEITLRSFAATDSTKPIQVALFRFANDTMTLQTTREGKEVNEKLAVPRGAIPFINPSIGLMEEIIRKSRAAGTPGGRVSIVVLAAPQQVAEVPVTFKSATEATIMLGDTPVAFKLDEQGRVLSGEVPSQSISISRK